MATLIESIRVSRDQDTSVERRERIQFFADHITRIEEFTEEGFFSTNEPMTSVTFVDGHQMVIVESYEKLANMRRNLAMAQACGRLHLINVQ